MFGLLKNKISSFISSLAGREEKKPAEKPSEQEAKEKAILEKKPEAAPAEKKQEPAPVEKKPEPKAQEKPKQEQKKPEPKAAEKKHVAAPMEKKPEAAPIEKKIEPKKAEAVPAPKPKEEKPAPKPVETKKPEIISITTPAPKKAEERIQIPKPEMKKAEERIQVPKPLAHKPEMQEPIPVPKPQTHAPGAVAPSHPEPDLSRLEKRAGTEKRAFAPKIGLGAGIKSFFSSDITIGEAEVSDLLEELELSLLEADVAYEVSAEVISQLRSSLVGMKVPKGEVEGRTKDAIRAVLESVMDSDRKFGLMERVKTLPKPVKILFVGPNGAGKTTTMAKLAHMFIGSGLTVVFSASDTFRAAAIEQTEVHAGRLGVKVIKSKYGADPASVAFDAINYARANSIDVVLIDSAGRQDTNANLLSELVKINRIAKPDIKIYIGESIGGNSIIDQIRAFNESIGMDGAILTKIDCDAKGGTAISVAKSTGIPVLFLGVGQGYDDLVPFDPHKIASEIMG